MTTLAYNNRAYSRAIAFPAFSRKKFFWMCMGGIVVLSLLYLYFIGGTVMHIVERKNIEAEIRSLSTQMSALESEYAERGKSLDLSQAINAGYMEVKNIAHVSRAPSLTMRND